MSGQENSQKKTVEKNLMTISLEGNSSKLNLTIDLNYDVLNTTKHNKDTLNTAQNH